MAFDGRVVRTYGRLKQKTIQQDNWISPKPLAGRKIYNVFSSPDDDSNTSSDASAINVSEKENLVPSETDDSKKPRRKAAKKANAALEAYKDDEKPNACKGRKPRQDKSEKGRQFSKLSRQYKKGTEIDSEVIVIEEDDCDDVHQNKKGTGRILRGQAASKPSDLSFDLMYNLAKQKKASKSSSSSDSVVSPILSDETSDGLELDGGVVETSTPYEAHQRSIGQSVNNRGCVTRRRAKRDVPFSPGGHGRRRAKRQRVVVPQILSFSEDDSFLAAPRRLRTRQQRDIMSDVASRLSAIHLDESSLCDSDENNEKSRTRECSVKLSRLSHESIEEELGHGSMDLFDNEDRGLDQDPVLDLKSEVRLRSCQVSVERISLSSGIGSDGADVSADQESMCRLKNSHRPFLRQRKDNVLKEPNHMTPIVNKSISRLALDSFKVALTPTKSKETGKLLSPKCKVLAQCDQEDFITFSTCLPSAMMKKCVKIGEGVYGEVFRSSNRDKSSVALKIIPVEGDFPVNEESQKPFEEILPEIVISRELSLLREGEDTVTTNFIEVNHVSCVQGSYPKKLLDEWDKYDRRKTSENDRPDLFPSDQLFIIFEFADGGRDLESFEFENIHQAVSVIRQVTGALAVAERELDFEHRDLHWGNVLVGATRDDQVTIMLDGQVISIDSQGLHVSIIDFTLSRLRKDDCTVFCDLAEDPTLFTGEGDKQFDVYRSMKEHNNNQWESFQPKTNVFWIEYLLDKIIWEKKYPTDRSQRKVLGQLKTLAREIQQFSSAEDVLQNSELLSIG